MDPITKLFEYLDDSRTPRTRENIRRIGRMLSMTDQELNLAIQLATD